ncbi:MAG: hypothetical protein V4689_11330 [Verrucomicrobiota bacterium]
MSYTNTFIRIAPDSTALVAVESEAYGKWCGSGLKQVYAMRSKR